MTATTTTIEWKAPGRTEFWHAITTLSTLESVPDAFQTYLNSSFQGTKTGSPLSSVGLALLNAEASCISDVPHDAWSWLRDDILSFGKLTDSWDDEGAKPPSQSVVAFALRVVGELMNAAAGRPSLSSAPVAMPVPDGTIRFEWSDNDKELLLNVDGAQIEALRWSPKSSFEPEGIWSIRLEQVGEMVGWLARRRTPPASDKR